MSGRRSVARGMGCSVCVRGCEGKGAAVSGDFGVPGFEVIRRIVIEFFWGKRCGYFGKPVYLESVYCVLRTERYIREIMSLECVTGMGCCLSDCVDLKRL